MTAEDLFEEEKHTMNGSCTLLGSCVVEGVLFIVYEHKLAHAITDHALISIRAATANAADGRGMTSTIVRSHWEPA